MTTQGRKGNQDVQADLSWVQRLRTALSAPLPDPERHDLKNPQQAEEWALLEFARLRRELEQEEDTKRRSFIQGQVCARVADGHSRAAAARMAGVTPETVSRWRRADPGFAEKLRTAEGGEGRPSRQHWRLKMTDSVQDAVVRRLGAGASRKEAAADAGVSRQTFYTWLKAKPDFRKAVLAAEARASARSHSGRRTPSS